MRITDTKYLADYQKSIGFDLDAVLDIINSSDKEIDLTYRIQAAAVFSSNIEGNTVDLSSFMNSMMVKQYFKPNQQIQEIEDLTKAYEFAKDNPLTEKNLLKVYKILTDKLLVRNRRGKYRDDKMGVFDSNGLVYLAIEPEFVVEKVKELFSDIKTLLAQTLSTEELFYHAALLHLKFVHIHPFWDGNGRTARLLEKWFLSAKMNSRAWKIQTEKYYKDHLSEYYAAINLGANYYTLNYDKCLPFLLFLPKALKEETIVN